MTTLVERWIDLPASGGAHDRFAANEPLGSGLMQIAASNACRGSRENNLRTLWEHPGAVDVEGDAGSDGFPGELAWDFNPEASFAPLILFAGVHRLRPYGETSRFPRIVLSCLASVSAPEAATIVLVARPSMGRPTPADANARAVTTAGTLTRISATLTVPSGTVGTRAISPRIGNFVPPQPIPEAGVDTVVALYVAAYRSGGDDTMIKGQFAGFTIYLIEP